MGSRITITVLRVCISETTRIDCDYRFISCITAVQHLDRLNVPVGLHSHMTIKLQLISLSVVVTLDHYSGVVDIFSI